MKDVLSLKPKKLWVKIDNLLKRSLNSSIEAMYDEDDESSEDASSP